MTDNTFLRKCGIRTEPLASDEKIAEALIHVLNLQALTRAEVLDTVREYYATHGLQEHAPVTGPQRPTWESEDQ